MAARTAPDSRTETGAGRSKRWLAGWAVGAAAFGALDGLWLGVLAKSTYRSMLGPLLAERVNGPAAAVFYGVYTLGIAHFATAPGVESRSVATSARQGAALGLVAYSTYDLSNLAVLDGFPARLAPIDIAWGTVATAAAAAVATAVVQRRRR